MNCEVVLDPTAASGIELRGQVREAFAYKGPRMILSGPSDTGKTFAMLLKMHIAALKYPGSQHAIMRKTFASLSGSVLMTLHKLIKGFPVKVVGGDHPSKYIYSNGSTIWVGGLDHPERTLSSERDTIFVGQAEELSVQDWEILSTRCTGRSSVMPYSQLYGDCNPAGSKHWILQHASEGRLKLFKATHRDNPSLYDAQGNLLPGAEKRIQALESLTGVRRKRLYEGLWVSVEGAVYSGFDRTVHEVHREESEMTRFFVAVDEGYTNPMVALLVGEDPDGRWHVFKEFYQTGVLQSQIVSVVRNWVTNYNVQLVAVDAASAGLAAAMLAHGIPAVQAKGQITAGIAKLQERLVVQKDGRPRLTFEPGCENTMNEFESYQWQPGREKDVPIKMNDHTCDALRYLEAALADQKGGLTGDEIKVISRLFQTESVEDLTTEGFDRET